ncbi:MAG: M28 family peptidase [Armatimonadetes bacterium]|nr:M28 family peptidase [Armatimonadota bacterium]MDE2206795.1 M28 family peptidase [Armatimonadota bacterium]
MRDQTVGHNLTKGLFCMPRCSTWRTVRATRCNSAVFGAMLAVTGLLLSRHACADVAAPLQKAYRTFYGFVQPSRLRSAVDTLTSFGSRVAGYPGDQLAGDWVLGQFKQLGLQKVTTDRFTVTVPWDTSVEGGNHGAWAEVAGGGLPGLKSGQHLAIHPLWPNLVRTSTLPAGGLTGPLIYAGNGTLSNFNGQSVVGAIVLVDFNCQSQWLNAPRLGAKAVIFVAPPTTMRGQAEAKFISIPIAIPRFWISPGEAAPLLAAAASGRPPTVTLHCNMPWVQRTCRNFTGVIPGTNPAMRNQVIVVQAYYDSTSIVPAEAPGAESSCGMAAMLEIIRAFKAHPPARTMMFVATSAHFQALQGIREYVNQHMDQWVPPGWLYATWRRLTGHPVKRKATNIYLWCGLDLTSHSQSFGIFYKGWFYDYRNDIQGRFSDIARVCRENADLVGQTIGFDSTQYFDDGVNSVNGKNWRNYIPGKPAFDSEAVTVAGGNGVTFATTNDSRPLVDTPFDTADRVNVANLARQVKLLTCLLWHIVTDTNAPGDINAQRMPITDPSSWSRLALEGGFATVQGRVELFNPNRSFIASPDPNLAGSLVVIHNRTKSFMGVRGSMVQMVVHHDNFFAFHGVAPLTAYGYNKPVSLSAYHLNADGDIDYAPDLGPSGAQTVPLDVLVTTSVEESPIILFRCVPTAIYDLVDQQSLKALIGVNVYDGETDGSPRMYGFAIDPQDANLVGSYVEDVAVLFSQPGTRLKIAMDSGPGATRLLLINAIYDPKHPNRGFPEGIGYLTAGTATVDMGNGKELARPVGFDPSVEIARGGAIYNTALHVAEDMWKLDDWRMRRLAKYRILNMSSPEGITGLHQQAAQAIAEAKQAYKVKDWETFDARSRNAWAYESRAYPEVQQIASDVVQGVLFYLALLMPFSYFLERLMFGYYDLKRRITASAVIFLAIFAIFRYIHPAFDITMNPMIVLLAFIMLALSCIVMALVVGKFEEELKKMNRSVTGIHRADIARFSVAMAAFSLGVSNMRRRKARTFLTCTTLVLLTFIMLSFTSVVQTMRFNKVPAPSDYGPRYNGIMIRTAMWDPLEDPAYRLLNDEYGSKHAVAPRAWFYGTQAGEQSFLTLQRADRSYDARALVGMTPAEASITRPQDALETDASGKVMGRWFEPGDTYTMILPDSIAEALRIDPRDVGKARVTYSGVQYTVIGILDSQKLKRYRDLDNETLTPVDFITMNKTSSSSSGGAAGQGFKEYTHLDPGSVFFIPYHTALDLGAEIRSIAIDFGNPKEVAAKLDPLMRRIGLNIYAGRITRPNAPIPRDRGVIERYSSLETTSSRGLELVFFPICIAALIVLNTMLNSVFERIKEIHIFSSIGLAPSHIGMLFIAEALVYAVLGSVAGYLLGQLTSKLLVWTGWLPDLYLNFSSMSAVMTTVVVVAVVLLSTLYPARRAADVATPAIERTWRVPEPQGDDWVIPMPFAVTGAQAAGLNSFLSEWFSAYEEYSIGDFVTQGVEEEEFDSEHGNAWRIKCMTWLAPFDLGVSQRVAIETAPSDTADVYAIRLLIHRESGDISNWKRVNRRFLNTLRKQFLIWRTLKHAERDKYLQEAAAPAAIDPNPAPAV